MKQVLRMGVLFSAMITVGCSPDNVQSPVGNPSQVEKTDPKTGPTIDSPWNGEWVFLSDTTLGTLHITNANDTAFDYEISGSQATLENKTKKSLNFEGQGTIEGNHAEATCEPTANCKMIIDLDGTTLTITINDETQDGSEITLNGQFKKANSIEEMPMLRMKNNQFQIYGISQGNKPSQVKAILGNPDAEGPDELIHQNWNQDYAEKELLLTYYDDWVETIFFTTTKDTLETAVTEHFKGERYRAKDGTEYLLVTENENLLLYRQNRKDHSKIDVIITVADENFYYNLVNNGIFKVE